MNDKEKYDMLWEFCKQVADEMQCTGEDARDLQSQARVLVSLIRKEKTWNYQ